jgi:uncharacterized protein VirK/YbjX
MQNEDPTHEEFVSAFLSESFSREKRMRSLNANYEMIIDKLTTTIKNKDHNITVS